MLKDEIEIEKKKHRTKGQNTIEMNKMCEAEIIL